MRRRRRSARGEKAPNHERWLVSYGDFITLLFAFFVVMYSVSSVNEGKYRVLSNTLNEAFRLPRRSINPIQIGELQQGTGALPGDVLSEAATDSTGSADPGDAWAEEKRLGYLAASIESSLEPYVDSGQVAITNHGLWMEVSIKSRLLFESGRARLGRHAKRVLGDLARILKSVPNPILVEGHTDDRPIHTREFPSNWELSAARAARVVRLFTRLGVDPKRLAAVGYGPNHPIADNHTEAGRRQNRRVTLVIRSGKATEAVARIGLGAVRAHR